MSNFTDRDLVEAIYDVRDRVTRIEEKLNRTEAIAKQVDEVEDKADNAQIKTMENARDIANLEKSVDNIKINNRWAWGIALTLAGLIIKLLMATP